MQGFFREMRRTAFEFSNAAVGFSLGNLIGDSLLLSLAVALPTMLAGRALASFATQLEGVALGERSTAASQFTAMAATVTMAALAFILLNAVEGAGGFLPYLAALLAAIILAVGGYLCIAAVLRGRANVALTLLAVLIVAGVIGALLATPVASALRGVDHASSFDVAIGCWIFVTLTMLPPAWIPVSVVLNEVGPAHQNVRRPRGASDALALVLDSYRGAWAGNFSWEAWVGRWQVSRQLGAIVALLAAVVFGMIWLRSGSYFLTIVGVPAVALIGPFAVRVVLALLWPIWTVLTMGPRWALQRDFSAWFSSPEAATR